MVFDALNPTKGERKEVYRAVCRQKIIPACLVNPPYKESDQQSQKRVGEGNHD